MKLIILLLLLGTALGQVTVGYGKTMRDGRVIPFSSKAPYGDTIKSRNLKYLDLTVRVPSIEEIRKITKNSTLSSEDVKLCCYFQQYQKTTAKGSGRWVPLIQVFCEHPTDLETTSFYLVHATDLPRWCKAKGHGDCKIRSGSILAQDTGDKVIPADCDHRLVFTTTTENPIYVTAELIEKSVLGIERDYIAAVILFMVLLILSFEVADTIGVLSMGLIVVLCFLAAAGRLPDGQEAFEWMNADVLFCVMAVTMLNAVLDRIGFDRWFAYRLYTLTKCHIRYSVLILWVISALLGFFMPGICAQMILTPISLALCKLARVEVGGVVCGQAFLVNTSCSILISGERLTKAVEEVFGTSYSDMLGQAIPSVLLCHVALFIYLYFVVIRYLPKSPPKGANVIRRGFLIREIVINDDKDSYVAGRSRDSGKEESKAELAADLKSRKRHYDAERYRLGKGHHGWRLLAWSAVAMTFASVLLFILGIVTDVDLGVSAIACGLGLAALIDFRKVARCFRDFNFRFILVSSSFSLFSNGISTLGMNRLMTRFVQDAVEGETSQGVIGIKLVIIFGICSCFIPNGTMTTALAPSLKTIIPSIKLSPALLAGSMKVAISVGACCTLLGSLGNLIAAEVCWAKEYEMRFITFTGYGLPASVIVLAICIAYYSPFFF